MIETSLTWIKKRKKQRPRLDSSRLNRTNKRRGFTLLEIIVVVTIIAAISALVFPRLGGRTHEIQGTVRKLAVVSRDLRNNSKLFNATYRLVIEMNDPDGREERPHRYWVERAEGSVIRSDRDINLEEREDTEDPTNAPRFSRDERIMRRVESLPRGMVFESVEIASLNEPITSGIAYIYYRPEGFTEEAVIHIRHGERLNWTVAIHPLTGKADILGERRTLSDLRQQQ